MVGMRKNDSKNNFEELVKFIEEIEKDVAEKVSTNYDLMKDQVPKSGNELVVQYKIHEKISLILNRALELTEENKELTKKQPLRLVVSN
jgi:hypothetical protein